MRKRKSCTPKDLTSSRTWTRSTRYRSPESICARTSNGTEFYGADALIVSGRFTGSAPDVEKVREAKTYAKRPILIGSGTSAEKRRRISRHADGIIVGTSLKKDGVMQNEVDAGRVRALMSNVQPVRERAAARASLSR